MSKKRASIQRVHQITKVPNNEIFTINHHGHNVNKWKFTRTRKSGHQFSMEMFFAFLSNLCQFMSVSFGNSGNSQRLCDRYLSLARLQSNQLCSRICLRFPKWKSLKILFVVKKINRGWGFSILLLFLKNFYFSLQIYNLLNKKNITFLKNDILFKK
jgi:hypothetical protein